MRLEEREKKMNMTKRKEQTLMFCIQVELNNFIAHIIRSSSLCPPVKDLLNEGLEDDGKYNYEENNHINGQRQQIPENQKGSGMH